MKAGFLLAVLLTLLLGLPSSAAEDAPSAEDLATQSLPLRTALHHDPTLAAPLARLLELYREADRSEDLVALYRAHLQQYPNDLPARVVYVRLLRETNDPEAARQLRTASKQHPTHGFLYFLRYESLDDEEDPHALDVLAEAIANEPLVRRKRRWIELLLGQALAGNRHELARTHLALLAQVLGGDAEAHLTAARRMHAFDLHARALQELDAASAAGPAPETGVEIDLLAATLALALGRRAQAAERLDALLKRLTADYWRRPEILRRRARLVSSAAERDEMLATARERVTSRPRDEAAVLDLARLLSGFERPREALTALRAGGTQLPASIRIEQEILAILLRLRDEPGRAAYLAERLATQPDRQDLREHWVKGLFLLGRTEEATQGLDQLLAKLPESLRPSRLLEMARFLRARGLAEDASPLYERIVTLRPDRLEVRRELAESLLAAGNRAGARQVLSAGIPAEVAPDVFLDLLQLLVQQRLHREAGELLDARRESHPEDLDVRLLSIEVGAALGRASSTARALADARPLADTPARYRRWLETGLAFHSLYDGGGGFLDAEQDLIAKETTWTQRAMGRLEAFLDVSVEAERTDPVIRHLQGLLQTDVPAPERLRLRRRLATLLGNKAGDELRSLIREDPAQRASYQARLALLHRSAQRLDLALPLLQQVDVRQIDDARLLGRLLSAQVDAVDGPKVLAILKRLTELEPTERGHWEKWISALTRSGDERTLRATLAHLLRGVSHLTIARSTRTALRAHLGDSFWRSISLEVGRQTEAGHLDALALLDEAERLSAADTVPLWLAWTRAFLQNELGRTTARDEAMGELERLAQQHFAADREATDAPARGTPAAGGPAPGSPTADRERIHFPDGLGVSWKAARALLTRHVVPMGEATPRAEGPSRPDSYPDRRGPQRANHVRWVFELEKGAAVTAIEPLASGRLLVADDRGKVFGLDRRTGKVLWRHVKASSPQGRVAAPRGGRQPFSPLPKPVLGTEGSFYLPQRGSFARYNADGVRQWRARMDGPQPAAAPVALVTGPGRVYAYEAGTGDVACFAATDGRLLWLRRLALPALSTPTPQGQGIALEQRRLLVYGPRTAILDAEDGSLLWTFEPNRVRTVPLTLEEGNEDLAGLFGRRRRRTHGRSGPGPARNASGTSPVNPIFPPPPPSRFFPGRWGSYMPGYPGARYPGGISFFPHRVFVPATGRSPAAAATRSPPAKLAVVSAAASWAGPLPAGSARLGLLTKRKLILCRSDAGGRGQALVLDLDLPMFARATPVRGTYVGESAERLCLLEQGRLLVWRPDPEQQSICTVSVTGGATSGAPSLAALDGGCAYVTGPAGTTCWNLATQTQVFQAPWPLASQPAPTLSPCRYTLRGVLRSNPQTGWGSGPTASGFAGEGTLFTLAAENRLVALDDGPLPAAVPADGGESRGR